MTSSHPRLFVTGATGQLGRLVIQTLLKTVPADRIVAGVRDPDAPAAKALGVALQLTDYAKPETLDFAGIDRLLLISSNAIGERVAQHSNVIAAAAKAGVGLVAYTSVLHAATSPLGLAEEHRQTEAALAAAGVPFVVLRNGWYTENYAAAVPAALAHGAVLGSAGDGRISSAARADYAEAAAAVLTAGDVTTGIYELAGDASYDLTQFAAEIARQSGKPVVYKNLPEADYKAALLGFGLPEELAGLLADSDTGAAGGALFDDGHQLSRLIGHPTTPFATTIAQALKA